MNITRLRLTGNGYFELPIKDATPSDPYILKAADGLGPGGLDVYISSPVNQVGIFQGRQPTNREIVLRIGINPDYTADETVEQLRDVLYGMLLSPGLDPSIGVQLLNGATPVAGTTGYVRRLEVVHFTQKPELLLTIACLSPYFEQYGGTLLDSGDFAFDDGDFEFTNVGNAPTGLQIVFYIGFPMSTFRWESANEPEYFMEINYGLWVGDVITINTMPGQRAITLNPDAPGPNVDMLPYLSEDSSWIELHGGLNQFTVTDAVIPTSAAYIAKFWGV